LGLSFDNASLGDRDSLAGIRLAYAEVSSLRISSLISSSIVFFVASDLALRYLAEMINACQQKQIQ
jgi:hypothetical protein